MNRWLPMFLLVGLCGPIAATERDSGRTDWFAAKKYGVFVHYLAGLQNDPDHVASLGRQTSWDDCVREFDTEKFAERMHEAGAGYVIFTIMQRSRFLIAPNATFDRKTGYRPGEACATRDLVEDLYQSLDKRGIALMLYWTGDGPVDDPKAAQAMGWPTNGQVTEEFVKNWAEVAREYGLRYKNKVKGYWTDGCYRFIGYDDRKLGILARVFGPDTRTGSSPLIPASRTGCVATPVTRTSPPANRTRSRISPSPDSSRASSGISCRTWERAGLSRGPSRTSGR